MKQTPYGAFIRRLREERGMSQKELADKIGISRSTYISIENGKKELSLDEANTLARLFGISVDELLSGHIPDISKYKQMILTYLRMDLSKDGKIPKTKLAKLLYLADFAWFYEKLESMSGMQYRKIAYGPVPDAFFRALDELEESGKIEIERKHDAAKDRDIILVKESESNRNEKIHALNQEERALMQNIGAKWKDKKTQEIVNFTHNQLPYTLCRMDEIIPYALITQEDPDAVF